jgi:quercetin dioxygenase-like cupin family protein
MLVKFLSRVVLMTAFLSAAPLYAEPLSAEPLSAEPRLLLKSDHSWNSESFYYPSGEPEITSVKLTLLQGKDAPFHCHPVPTMGFISKGKVLLETPDGKSAEYGAGESVVEVMQKLHRGKALSEEAEIIVFYAGVKNIPNTVFPEDIENFKRYCR